MSRACEEGLCLRRVSHRARSSRRPRRFAAAFFAVDERLDSDRFLRARLVVVGAEVGVDDQWVGSDLVRRPLGDDLALGEDDHPVADVVDDVHVVLDEHHGHALGSEGS